MILFYYMFGTMTLFGVTKTEHFERKGYLGIGGEGVAVGGQYFKACEWEGKSSSHGSIPPDLATDAMCGQQRPLNSLFLVCSTRRVMC